MFTLEIKFSQMPQDTLNYAHRDFHTFKSRTLEILAGYAGSNELAAMAEYIQENLSRSCFSTATIMVDIRKQTDPNQSSTISTQET